MLLLPLEFMIKSDDSCWGNYHSPKPEQAHDRAHGPSRFIRPEARVRKTRSVITVSEHHCPRNTRRTYGMPTFSWSQEWISRDYHEVIWTEYVAILILIYIIVGIYGIGSIHNSLRRCRRDSIQDFPGWSYPTRYRIRSLFRFS